MAKQINETTGKTLGRAGFYCKADPRNCRKDIGTLLGFMAKQFHETAGKTLGHCWVLWRSRSTKLPERHWDTAGFYGEADPRNCTGSNTEAKPRNCRKNIESTTGS